MCASSDCSSCSRALGLLPLGQVADEAGEVVPLAGAHLADRQLHREGRAVLALADHDAADADDAPLAGGEIALEIAVVLLAIGRRHQHADVLADDLAGGIAEQPLGRRAEATAMRAALVDDDHRVRHGLQDRAQMRLGRLQRQRHRRRSAEITRLYLQVAPDETLDDWPDHRIWNELRTRLARVGDWELTTGPVLEKGITPMRSFVAEPMQHRRLFLAGDAAHIVPATGAKGLNLAVADVTALAAGLTAWYASGRTDLLDSYSRTCLQRVWRVQHFSWWMTSMLHKLSDDAFDERLQLSQLRLRHLVCCRGNLARRELRRPALHLPGATRRRVRLVSLATNSLHLSAPRRRLAAFSSSPLALLAASSSALRCIHLDTNLCTEFLAWHTRTGRAAARRAS